MRLAGYNTLHNNNSFERWVDQAFENALGSSNFFNAAFNEHTERGFAFDVYGDNENYYVVAELPGVEKSDIDVELEKAVLTIRSKRVLENGSEKKEISFNRTVKVGNDINAQAVNAAYENGILTVTLPKSEATKARNININ